MSSRLRILGVLAIVSAISAVGQARVFKGDRAEQLTAALVNGGVSPVQQKEKANLWDIKVFNISCTTSMENPLRLPLQKCLYSTAQKGRATQSLREVQMLRDALNPPGLDFLGQNFTLAYVTCTVDTTAQRDGDKFVCEGP